MNWIKDIIPNIKRNLSQTFGEDRQRSLRAFGVHVKIVVRYFTYQSLKRAPMYVLNVGTISKLMYQIE
jgi:hypothetical protein